MALAAQRLFLGGRMHHIKESLSHATVIKSLCLVAPLSIGDAVAQDYLTGCKSFAQANYCKPRYDKQRMTCVCMNK
jgi:hypothetical protein